MRYDLNQIPYDYTVEVTNRFKELDLVDRVLEELREVHDIIHPKGDQSRVFTGRTDAEVETLNTLAT